VYVCRYGRDVDFVKVLDFGLVKSEHEAAAAQLSLTGDHGARGTPAFMSPEQVLGDRPMDGRTDIYAAGCLGYWLVTGQHVFSGKTAMETMVQHTQATPIPPSQRARAGIPPAFDEVILACLRKNPDERPPSADELAARLAAIPGGLAWTSERRQTWWDTHLPVSATPQVGEQDDRGFGFRRRLRPTLFRSPSVKRCWRSKSGDPETQTWPMSPGADLAGPERAGATSKRSRPPRPRHYVRAASRTWGPPSGGP
jgi:eukaryotic-like serine/threonine-protein kinase